MPVGFSFGWIGGGGGGTPSGGVNAKYGTAVGANTYAGTFTNLTTMAVGQVLFVNFTDGNTGPATLNPNGIGAITMLKFGDAALENGDLKAGQIAVMCYDGTNLQILSVTDNIAVGP